MLSPVIPLYKSHEILRKSHDKPTTSSAIFRFLVSFSAGFPWAPRLDHAPRCNRRVLPRERTSQGQGSDAVRMFV